MPRHPPTVIDVSLRAVSARDGLFYPVDRLALSGANLYFSRHGANDPRIAYQERWLLPERGWDVIRWTLEPGVDQFGYDWYVDIDRIERVQDRWSITDRYVDVTVREGIGYEVLDADEMADAVECGNMAIEDALSALRALDDLCRSLRRFDFSVRELLRELAPDLPA